MSLIFANTESIQFDGRALSLGSGSLPTIADTTEAQESQSAQISISTKSTNPSNNEDGELGVNIIDISSIDNLEQTAVSSASSPISSSPVPLSLPSSTLTITLTATSTLSQRIKSSIDQGSSSSYSEAVLENLQNKLLFKQFQDHNKERSNNSDSMSYPPGSPLAEQISRKRRRKRNDPQNCSTSEVSMKIKLTIRSFQIKRD